jgi:hypothetical protein
MSSVHDSTTLAIFRWKIHLLLANYTRSVSTILHHFVDNMFMYKHVYL